MAKTDTLHIRVEPEIKKNAENTLNKLGLSTTEAINIFLKIIKSWTGLSFGRGFNSPRLCRSYLQEHR